MSDPIAGSHSTGTDNPDTPGGSDRPSNRLTASRIRLRDIERQTGIKPVLIYAVFVPSSLAPATPDQLPDDASKTQEAAPVWQFNAEEVSTLLAQARNPNRPPQDDDYLLLFVVTAEGEVVVHPVSSAQRATVLAMVNAFRDALFDPLEYQDNGTLYLASAQGLYQWLIAPLQPTLQQREIGNLVFLMDAGLRSLPMAALHNGHQFLVEQYSLGLMPSLNLTDTRYNRITDMQVLAMAASNFTNQAQALPAAPLEVTAIARELWDGQAYLNEAFTRNNLITQRQQRPFGIIHLATHANFQTGAIANSYIQLWDEQLRLDEIRQLGWHDPPVELVVLSACRTDIGDHEAELGFAGFAVQAGVKSALASLWTVNDVATWGLMAEFYHHLRTAPIKAEALQRAQLALLRGEVQVNNEQLQWLNSTLDPQAIPQGQEIGNLAHPYYWAGFTMIGSPW